MIESEFTLASTSDVAPLFEQRPLRSRGRLVMRRIRSVIANDPVFLPIVLRATPRGTSRRITAATDVVVEGYPRSGNTFAAAALRHVGGPDLTVASHVHTTVNTSSQAIRLSTRLQSGLAASPTRPAFTAHSTGL